jgi:AraC-like DNA-binding protein
MSAAYLPVAFVAAILEGYRKYGLSPDAALAEAGITPAQLSAGHTAIDTAQFQHFMDRSMRLMDDEALGWFSRPFWWGSYGMLARASFSAPDLRTALRRWCRSHNLLTRDVVLRVTESAGTATIAIIENVPLGVFRELCLVSILRNALGYASWLIDSRIACMDAAFPFARPPHHAAYRSMFPTSVRFDARHASVSMDATYLDLPVRRDETSMSEMLADALPLLTDVYRRDRLLIQRLRAILVTNLQTLRTAEDMARTLGMSVRSLYRQLNDEGTSLQALKDEVRRDQSLQLLHRSNLPLKQIAATTGFSNEKTFSRAFRRWFGKMPSQYRRELKAAGKLED